MNDLKVVLITRRFWPLVGGAEMFMMNLADAFCQRGLDVTILTAAWDSNWPLRVVFRDIPVVRIPQPRGRGWGTFRYMMGLQRWLRERERADLVYVSMLKHDAHAAVTALRGTRIPVVLRAEGGGATGDCTWQQSARFGLRIRRRCQQSAAVIAPSQPIRDELLAAAYDARRVHVIANGTRNRSATTVTDRRDARLALAAANAEMMVSDRSPVVAYTGRLHEGKGLLDLIHAWPKVLARWPRARLWLIGDGPQRDVLWRHICDMDLRGTVLMPGLFDTIEDILHAADLFVLPSYEEGMSLSLLEAMQAGLPVVATDIPGNRAILNDQTGRLVPPHTPAALSRAMLELLENREQASLLGLHARQFVHAHYSLEQVVDRHLELFTALVGRS